MSDCCGAGAAPALASPPTIPFATETRRRVVAIVGPPNSGKSTLFNLLTGLRQKVANYPGVTVEQHVGRVRLEAGREIDLIDLPGVYSLSPRSEDERITRDVLSGKVKGTPKPDAVLLIIDCTNLDRNLTLAAPILKLGLPTLVVLNMADELERRGGHVDLGTLARELGASVVKISAAKVQGIELVRAFLASNAAPPCIVSLPVLQDVPACRKWAARINESAGYRAPAAPLWTRRLDGVFLHPIGGPLIFAAVIVAVFQTIFAGARPLMDAIEFVIASSGSTIAALMPDTWLRSLIVDGVWNGVGSVIIFLPQILLLFLFIGILEDSGYLARAALIADRTMARVGLQGKSFIPLLSAYACAVPAILSTRTIENRRDRIATILIAPLMTCSARLPVYILIIAAFLPDRQLLGPFLSVRAAAMIGLYLLGFAAAFVTARLLKSSVLKSDSVPFVLEMPPYRWPTLRSLGLRLLDRSKVFLRRAGTVILAVAIVLWAMCSLPAKDGKPPAIEDSYAGAVGHAVEPLIEPLGFNWKIGLGLITSLAAREVIVGTLGTIYGMEDPSHSSLGLQQALRQDLSLAGAVGLLVFFAFAMQCMSTVAVVRRETGSWKWPVIQFAYMSGLAYFSALVAYRVLA